MSCNKTITAPSGFTAVAAAHHRATAAWFPLPVLPFSPKLWYKLPFLVLRNFPVFRASDSESVRDGASGDFVT